MLTLVHVLKDVHQVRLYLLFFEELPLAYKWQDWVLILLRATLPCILRELEGLRAANLRLLAVAQNMREVLTRAYGLGFYHWFWRAVGVFYATQIVNILAKVRGVVSLLFRNRNNKIV